MSTLGGDPGAEHDRGGEAKGAPPPPLPEDRRGATPARSSGLIAVKAVSGALAGLLGFYLIWGGIAPLTEARDGDGYYMSDLIIVDRPSRAIITGDMDLLRGRWETLAEESLVDMFLAEPDDVRIRGVASGPDAIFLGVAATAAVDGYLDGVAHDKITDWETNVAEIDVEYTPRGGTASPEAPDGEAFWVVSVSGTGSQTLDWTIESGDWTAVIMNADASSGVMAELAFGALPPSSWDTLHWISLAVGPLLVVVGSLLLYWARLRPGGRS